ncbi:hypothetical protein A7A08_01859 [Methyloligella halotolerans]|uniref:Phage DNA packaging protein Nu1 n=1 Tax=Methyloligella halotolerans TaxID=1177755 RepID=A0A1E2RY10_9HYPH|nr:hypothetical protein [Methyloligella halotolerans]ODA67113.1 hypothetical protein A7A08_01859 [Methyloligella halotolerans]
MEKTIITKGEYARLKGRAPSCVSNWIAEGKITPAALAGTGTRAKIWVERADADLEERLDPAQQIAQERTAFAAQPISSNDASSKASGADGDFVRAERKARAAKAVNEARFAQLKAEKESGRWIETEMAQRAWRQELSQLIDEFETFLTSTLARTLAEAHDLDAKALSIEIRDLYHAHRRKAAARAKEELSTEAELPAPAGSEAA